MNPFIRISTLFLFQVFIISQLEAQLKMIETDHMRMVSYDFGHDYILPHAAKCFHNTLYFHNKLFDYKAEDKVSVLIQDFGDFGNAGATAVPFNFITMGLSPFSYAFETSPAGERVYSMMNHELVHVVALDNATKKDRGFQKFFMGKVNPTSDNPISMFYSYMTSPRMYSPRWYHEGIAAYVETWMNGGIGLALGSFDEMVFRTLVLDEAHIYSAQGLESEGVTTDFQGRSNSYLYGTRFMGYLSHEYGPDKVIEWVKRNEGSKGFFAGQFKNIFEIPINEGWQNWIAFERKWQNANIESLKLNPTTEGQLISSETLGSISYPHYDKKRNKLYVAVNRPGQYPSISAINMDNGQLEHLTDIKGPALFYVSSVIYDEHEDVLFFTSDNNAWRDLMSYNLKSGKVEMHQKDFRTGDLALNKVDKSIWGIKHLNGLSTIVRIPQQDEINNSPKEYDTWEQIYTLPYGQDIFDIDISPDGTTLSAAVTDLKANQYLLLYDIPDLLNNQISVDTIFNFEVSSPQSFRYTEDGAYLYGSSYYSGVSNIFRVNMENRKIQPMSNALTGLFRPLPLPDGRLLAFEFASDGFKPVFIPHEPVSSISSIDFLGNATVSKHKTLIDWELPISTTEDVDLESVNVTETLYKAGKEMNVNYAYPIIVGYKDRFGIGYKFNISDPINLRELNFNVSYTPDSWNNSISNFSDTTSTSLDGFEQFHFAFTGRVGSFTLTGAINEANFYDLFGPKITSKKGISGGINFEHSIIWDMPKSLTLNTNLNGFYGLERSPEFQQIMTSGFDNSFFLRLGASLDYKFLKSSLGAVDSEKGFASSLSMSIAQSGGNYFPTLTASLDYGFQLPINHSSIWLRADAGNSFNSDLNPFTRFGFAAFGNNYVDHHAYRRYRDGYSFPGLSYSNSYNIIAKEYFKGTAEFVLPPIRYRKFGGFNFFANWTQPTVFSSILAVNDPLVGDAQYMNIGAQVDTRMVVFSHLESTLSFGYARAWQLNEDRNFGEFMISLKLLH